ncbi:hypothetical protein HU200_030494 [Digitaria exilis]|uniref:Biogenesis of lysosome-related organelles complex 1 subunit 1 n=1 Tax=Digitaria exilis TaxID=1010633 RepID=A0A835C050_9POAL|nr:hypothetical protein HU200_030494 [Digitaria exilis]
MAHCLTDVMTAPTPCCWQTGGEELSDLSPGRKGESAPATGEGWTEPSRRRGLGSRSWKRRCSRSYNSTTTNPSANDNKLRAKKDALRSAVRVADLLVDAVDGGVQELFVNEKRIELEARALLSTIARYRKQTDQWLTATNEINS